MENHLKKPRGATATVKGPTDNDPALLTRKQLSPRVNLSTRTIDNLQKRKVIPVIKLSARCCRFSLEAVLRALGRFEVKESTR